MSFWTKLIGGGVGEVVDGVANAIDRFVETPDEKAAAKILLLKMEAEKDRWQAEINKTAANHRNPYVAGARPTILYICAGGLLFAFIVNPLIMYLTNNYGVPIPLEQIMSLVYGLLGLGTLRTIEKLTGRTK